LSRGANIFVILKMGLIFSHHSIIGDGFAFERFQEGGCRTFPFSASGRRG